jgi:hypothetical protein
MAQENGHHDLLIGEEVASTTPHTSHRPAHRAAPRAAPQCAAERASVAQSVPAPSGPLMAARELLRNPPGEAASPDAHRQWRDDVDRLLNLAQASPGSAGGYVSRLRHRQGGASGSVHSPSVRSARTEDLRAELNRRHAGEDARISIERVRNRQLNIGVRVLAPELDAAAARQQEPAQAPVSGVGCAALADHLRAVAWPSKFRPHLPKKYDGSSNPSEFLQVYITAITAAGGNEAVMASYFHVALTGPARTWLMNLTPGSIQSWGELYAQFMANFASAYQQHGVEAHLHAVRQQPGETLRTFISRFTKVRGTILRISDASIIMAFRQGVRDEKMLEKLATHQVETVTTLFALADKCARAAEDRAWHSATQAGPAQMSGPSVAAPGSGKKKNKKNRGFDKSRIRGSAIAAATTGGQNSRGKRPRQQRTDPGSCPVHPGARHSATECCEIQKLAEHLSKRRDQASREGTSPPWRSGKEKVSNADTAATERELGYQTPNKDLKGLFHQSDSESGGDERRKKLYVMYGGSADLVSRRDVKTLCREVLSVKPATPKAAPHQRWKSITISFGPSDCPENMAGAGVLPLVMAPTIANVRLHHVLIDGGAGLSVISYAAFKHLQILESKRTPSRPFSGVGPDPVYPVGTISLPVTFGTEDNFRTENVQFEVADVNLPFNAIIGRPALYRFMAIAHYGT